MHTTSGSTEKQYHLCYAIDVLVIINTVTCVYIALTRTQFAILFIDLAGGYITSFHIPEKKEQM